MIPPRRRSSSTRRAAGRRGLAALVLGVVAAGLLAPLGAPTAYAAARPAPPRADEAEAPTLDVRLDEAPAALPRGARDVVTLRGEVANRSKETWTDLNVYATITSVPLTSAAALASISPSASDLDAGMRRLTEGRVFTGIGDLAPGDSAEFTLRVQRRLLAIPSTPGVHLLGVQVLGASPAGRDLEADGSARVAVPLPSRRPTTAQVALVVPLRGQVRRYADDSLREPIRWARLVSEEGRLDRLLALAEASDEEPVSLLVDPAVVDAVRTLALEVEAEGAQPAEDNVPQSWLDRFAREAGADTVLGLGYGDPDVASLARHDPDLLTRSFATGESFFADSGIEVRRTVAPPTGLLPSASLDDLPDDTTALLRGGADRSGVAGFGSGGSVVFADSGVRAGGVDESRSQSPLALRQRILSEAMLASLADRTDPVVAMLPPTWMPGPTDSQDDFFAGLDQPWLQLTGLPALPDRALEGRLPNPAPERRQVLGKANVESAQAILRAGQQYAEALVDPTPALQTYTRIAMEPVSVLARRNRVLARNQAEEVRVGILRALDGIRVEASGFVTMGRQGTIVVSIANDLPLPVEVGVRALGDGRITIDDGAPVRLQPGQRTTLRLAASARAVAVEDVRLSAVTDRGETVGTPAEVTIRSSNVGLLIWAVMGIGAAVLLVAIGRRLLRGDLHTRAQDAA